MHSGRGGAGNIRSPSRNPEQRIDEEREASLQEKLVAESRGREADAPFSTGRGGVGNISRSKSRSRSAVRNGGTPDDRHVRAGGRGGFGNISEENRDSVDSEKRRELDNYEAKIASEYRAGEEGKP
jgi:hypothetical protein